MFHMNLEFKPWASVLIGERPVKHTGQPGWVVKKWRYISLTYTKQIASRVSKISHVNTKYGLDGRITWGYKLAWWWLFQCSSFMMIWFNTKHPMDMTVIMLCLWSCHVLFLGVIERKRNLQFPDSWVFLENLSSKPFGLAVTGHSHAVLEQWGGF